MKTVTFETQCWENDYELVLNAERLQKVIENCGHAFTTKHVIINKVYNRQKATALALECKNQGIIDDYYFAEDHVDIALQHFGIKASSFKGGYYYSRCQLVGLYLSKTDYLIHFTSDSYIEEKPQVPWIAEAITKMEADASYVCATPCWNIGHGAHSLKSVRAAARSEAITEDDTWFAGFGFSDNCYLVPTKLFKQQIYGEYNKASDRYPEYAGECFEKRVDSYMRNHNLLRIVNKNVWYSHDNFPRKPLVTWLGRRDKITRLMRGVVKKTQQQLGYKRLETPPVKAEVDAYRKTIKIYDIFTFFNELELLEIRLNILAPYVDYFVIIEAPETFSGIPKELIYEKNKQRFAKFHDKIIHYVIENIPPSEDELRSRLAKKSLSPLDRQIITDALTSDNVPKGALHWLKEFYQKESIKKALINLHDNDVCFVGDIDEIWNPETVVDFRRDDIFKLRQDVYSYYLNNRSSEPWAGTLVTKYKNIKDSCLNHLRTVSKTKYTYVAHGGWHFTNQGGPDRIRQKIESYGHQEFNNATIKEDIENKIAKNQDFVGRRFKFWIDESALPEYVVKNREKLKDWFATKQP